MTSDQALSSQSGKTGWIVALALALSLAMPLSAQAQQVSEAQYYHQVVNTHLGAAYAHQYADLVRAGWPPQKAYYSIWAYQNGWKLGYMHGWHDGAYQISRNRNQQWAGPWLTWMHTETDAWLKAHQSWHWSKDVWGAFQKGYHDSYDKAMRAGWNRQQHLDRAYVPGPDRGDFGRAARNARSTLDPNDPWSDLPLRPQITGPGSF